MFKEELSEIRPVDGRHVPDPQVGSILPKEGRKVIIDQYWQRRLRDGDVVIVNPAAPKRSKSDN